MHADPAAPTAASSPTVPAAVRIDADRLWRRLHDLAAFTEPDQPWTRRAFSVSFQQGRDWLRQQFEAAGLQTRMDSAGNLIGRLEGSAPGLPPLATGSHSDTVPHGGRFDGVLGVLAGLEAVQSIRESGLRLRHPLEVIDFLGEEPSDHGVSCIGSRACAGHLDAGMLALRDGAGESLAAAMARIGARPGELGPALRPPGSLAAFVELHIEQGPVLEARQLPIGVVTNIVGIRRYTVTVAGRADHAGTTPMHLRQDALVGAAEVIAQAQRLAASHGDGPPYVVATVGRLALTPNAANSVPGHVSMTLEVRSDAPAVLDGFVHAVMAASADALNRLRVTADVALLTRTEPVACDPRVMAAIEAAAARLQLGSMRLPSGAGHDAMHLAEAGPVGMVFVPCRDGRSHCPEEWIEPDQAAAGTAVLAQALVALDGA